MMLQNRILSAGGFVDLKDVLCLKANKSLIWFLKSNTGLYFQWFSPKTQHIWFHNYRLYLLWLHLTSGHSTSSKYRSEGNVLSRFKWLKENSWINWKPKKVREINEIYFEIYNKIPVRKYAQKKFNFPEHIEYLPFYFQDCK